MPHRSITVDESIHNLMEYFNKEKQNNGPLTPLTAVHARVSDALKIDTKTISNALRHQNQEENKENEPPQKSLKTKDMDQQQKSEIQYIVAMLFVLVTCSEWRHIFSKMAANTMHYAAAIDVRYHGNNARYSILCKWRHHPLVPKDSNMLHYTSVRVVPLLAINETDASPKYRFLRQQGLQPARQLPSALIIGVKKGGTRALLEFIRIHPDVRAAGSEVHFFDKYYAKGFEWYRHHMPLTLEGQITIEKSPSYFITKEAPRRVQHMNPSTKLLVVVRDPVTRSISDYTQAASKKPEMKPFEQLAFVNGSIASNIDTSWGPIKLGIYARYLISWLNSSEYSSDQGQSTSEWECVSDSEVDFDHEFKETVLKGTTMSIQKDPKLYLGISRDIYFCKKIPCAHQDILIVLKKIRLNESYSILAMQFAKSAANIGQIFKQTVHSVSKYFREHLPVNAIKCHLCKNYYHDSCSKRVKTRSDGAFIKCCGDDDILDISDGVSSDVVNGQGDLDFHDASSAIENKLEGTTVTHDDFKQFYINFEKFMNDKLNKYNAIYNKLDNKIDSSNKMLIEQVNKHVSDGIDSIKTVIAKIEQKIEYNEKIVENAVERIDSIEADVRELINKECNDEIVLNEIKERMQQRERNIIFFNIKENASEEEDTKTINNLLSNTHIDLSGLQVLRLGKHNPSIIRPLRVRFNSLDDVLWILRN
ncbi:hypothetical protein FQA39_LY16025 [Lamprigera yunnana]|nr:hypothetical protein FQA39_LY16025 [Lamprigera yunnana]